MTTSTAIRTPELDVLGARSGRSGCIHTPPARGLSDLPPSQKRITRVYRDLANNVPVAPLGGDLSTQPQKAQLFIGVAAAVASVAVISGGNLDRALLAELVSQPR
jgi:hypothetical protein